MSLLCTRQVRAALILGMIGLAPARAVADELRLESSSLPAPLIDNGKVNTVIEASAVEPIGDVGSQTCVQRPAGQFRREHNATLRERIKR